MKLKALLLAMVMAVSLAACDKETEATLEDVDITLGELEEIISSVETEEPEVEVEDEVEETEDTIKDESSTEEIIASTLTAFRISEEMRISLFGEKEEVEEVEEEDANLTASNTNDNSGSSNTSGNTSTPSTSTEPEPVASAEPEPEVSTAPEPEVSTAPAPAVSTEPEVVVKGCAEGYHNNTGTGTYSGDKATVGCGVPIYEILQCMDCGLQSVNQLASAYGDHTYVATEVVPMGCTTWGYTIYTCTGCGNSYKVNEPGIPDCTGVEDDGKCDRCGTVYFEVDANGEMIV